MKKKAYITGASSGIGESFANTLADSYHLVIIARNNSRLSEIAKTLSKKTEVEIFQADLSTSIDVDRLANKIIEEPNLGMLVNNAGFGTNGEFATLDISQEVQEIQLNVIALVKLAHAAINRFKQQKSEGVIINVASIAGFLPVPLNATYAATKAFVKSFSEAIHEEVKHDNILVQALCPGLTRTEFQDRASIDAKKFPDFLWMTSEEVVEESLEGLKTKAAICVPGILNKSTSTFLDIFPTDLVRSLMGNFRSKF
jgi:uncharacterized protein